jgi:hypothetical protein
MDTEASEAGSRDFRRVVVLALGMGRTRYLIIVAALALLVPARAAAAESPSLYVGSGPGWSIVFKVEGAKVSVIGVDATVYCEIGRREVAPEVWKFFPTPALMHEEGDGLTGSEVIGTPKSESRMQVDATVAGEGILGSFEYVQTGEPGLCRTVDYPASGNPAEVSFEAVRYEPADGAPPAPPLASADRGVYYGTEGPLETFFTVSGSHLALRGTVGSGCLPATAKRGPGRRPLDPNLLSVFKAPIPILSGILKPSLTEGTSFREMLRTHPGREYSVDGEAITVAGSVGDEAIVGTYYRRFHTFFPKTGKRVCQTGPLPFRAQRYLPATP